MNLLPNKRSGRKGFSLVEIMAVVFIIGISLTMVVPSIVGSRLGAGLTGATGLCERLAEEARWKAMATRKTQYVEFMNHNGIEKIVFGEKGASGNGSLRYVNSISLPDGIAGNIDGNPGRIWGAPLGEIGAFGLKFFADGSAESTASSTESHIRISVCYGERTREMIIGKQGGLMKLSL